jgi:hypothetical protein
MKWEEMKMDKIKAYLETQRDWLLKDYKDALQNYKNALGQELVRVNENINEEPKLSVVGVGFTRVCRPSRIEIEKLKTTVTQLEATEQVLSMHQYFLTDEGGKAIQEVSKELKGVKK